jgi:hypothetical protein
MDSSSAAAVCVAAPERFWFGLLLLLSFLLLAVTSSHSRTCPSTLYIRVLRVVGKTYRNLSVIFRMLLLILHRNHIPKPTQQIRWHGLVDIREINFTLKQQ